MFMNVYKINKATTMTTIVPDFNCYYETLILKYGNSHLTNYWL